MKPSRKILLGAPALALGILIQITIAALMPQFVEGYSGTEEAVRRSEVDSEKIHNFQTLIFAGACSGYLLIVMGLIMVFVGVYQTAKTTERALTDTN